MAKTKADPKEKEQEVEERSFLEIYEAEGIVGLAKEIGVELRALYVEIGDLLNKAPELPEPDKVFKALGPENDNIPAVLKLMGIDQDSLAPGKKPWAFRQDPDDGRDVLTIVTGAGKKLVWKRPLEKKGK